MRPGPTVCLAAAAALAVLALAMLVVASSPASAGEVATGELGMTGGRDGTVRATGETVDLALDVRSDGLDADELMYLGVRDLPRGWTQDVPGAVPTAKGFQIPQEDAGWDIRLDLGDATPAGTYELEVGLDRGSDLSELAALRVAVEVTPYTFTTALEGIPAEPVLPGARLLGVLWVRHDAPQAEAARVTVRSFPDGWQVFVGQPMLAVPSGESSSTQLLIQPTQGYPPGAGTVVLHLSSPDPRFASALIEAVVDVAELPGLSFVSAPPLQALLPGSSARVDLALANTGNLDLELTSVAVDASATPERGWTVSAAGLPARIAAKSTAVLRATVTVPSGPETPLAGEHELPLVVATDLASVILRLALRVPVAEVRALAFAPVDLGAMWGDTYGDTNLMAFSVGYEASLDDQRKDLPGGWGQSGAPPDQTVPINPNAEPRGTGYVEVVDLGNLGRYRKVHLSAAFERPVEDVSFTKDTVFLWTGRSWVVGVDITVAADAAPGDYLVTVTATDPDGGSVSTGLGVIVYHLSARLGGALRMVPLDGAFDSGAPPSRGGIVIGEEEGVDFAGTVVNTCDALIPRAEVLIYDVLGASAVLYQAIPIENLTAREERIFLFRYSSSEPGEHQLVAQLQVPGAVPDAQGHEAVVPTTVSEAAAPSGWGALALPLVLGTVAGLGVGLLAILGTEAGMWAMLALLLVPLYTRLRRDQVTDQFVRGQILGYVKANPGETYASIKRALRLSNGQFVYHARVLESQGLIRSVKDGANRRFYPAGMRIPREIQDLKLNQVQRIIYTIVMEYPGISQRKLARMVNLSPSTVSYHVNIMTKIGVIERRRSGRLVLCFANGD